MSKFSDKFVDGMSLVAEKVDENKFLGAIKDSFTIYMPFVIVGSFMSLFNTILCSTTTGLAKWIPALEALKPIFTAANFATLSCMTLPIVFLIGLKLGKKNNVPEHKAYKQYFDLIFGSTLLTLGIYLFVTPNGINFGGVIGLAQIIEIFLRRFIAIRSDANLVGMINFLINVPLFLIGYRVMSRRFCIKTMLSVAVQTLLLSVLPPLKAPLVEDVLLNCIFGAILCGVGVGYALRGSGCCGGMDIACMCLVKKYPDFKSGRLSIYVNAVLFSVCLFLFDLETTMYSIIFVAILYTVADRFHDQNINVAALIFTDVSTVQTEILQKMGRGVTFWNGYGAYTNHPKKILFCAVNKYEIGELQEIIHEQDPNAFVTFFVGPLIHGGFEKRL